ncbi:MAG: SsrA-binding protein SmpB [bacterium]
MPSLAVNKRARLDHEILEKYEAGIVLTGAEVKSLRAGNAKLQGTYITVARGELWLIGAHIGKYVGAGAQEGYDPTRSKKLLVHKKEMLGLAGKIQQAGLTLVPLELYTAGRRIKLSFALARGKKLHDKREDLKRRDLDRDIRNQ